MAYRKHDSSSTIEVIPGNVTSVPEFDHQFPKFWQHTINGAPNLWVFRKHPYAVPYREDGASSHFLTLWGQKIMQSMQIPQRSRRPTQTWHSGTGTFLPSASLVSHSSASCSVRCRPVRSYSSQAARVSRRNCSRFSSRATYSAIASRMIQCADRRRASASRCTRSLISLSSFRLVVDVEGIE